MSTVLITGFEPFGDDLENPSATVTRALDGWAIDGALVHSMILPVERTSAERMLAGALHALSPDVVIATGLAAGRAGISLERVALNVRDYPMPDNAGRRVSGTPVLDGAPFALQSRLPLERCRVALSEAGIPSELSATAGSYLCNEIMYLLLHTVHGTSCRAGFVHVPYASDYIARRGRLAPSLPLPMLVESLRIITRETLRWEIPQAM